MRTSYNAFWSYSFLVILLTWESHLPLSPPFICPPITHWIKFVLRRYGGHECGTIRWDVLWLTHQGLQPKKKKNQNWLHFSQKPLSANSFSDSSEGSWAPSDSRLSCYWYPVANHSCYVFMSDSVILCSKDNGSLWYTSFSESHNPSVLPFLDGPWVLGVVYQFVDKYSTNIFLHYTLISYGFDFLTFANTIQWVKRVCLIHCLNLNFHMI